MYGDKIAVIPEDTRHTQTQCSAVLQNRCAHRETINPFGSYSSGERYLSDQTRTSTCLQRLTLLGRMLG